MGKLFIFYLTLEIVFLNFSNGTVLEKSDEINTQRTVQEKSIGTVIPTTSTVNVTKNPIDDIDGAPGVRNNTGVKVNTTEKLNSESNHTKVITNIINNITAKYPETSKNINNTLQKFGITNPTVLLMNLNKSNLTLNDLQSSINQTKIQKEINNTRDLANSEVSKAVLKHRAEIALKDIDKAMSNTSLSGVTNRTTDIVRQNWNFTRILPRLNLTMLLDPDFDPNLWLKRLQAPWKHVSESNSVNETEVLQVCKFEGIVATCSAEYSTWRVKAWFEFAESPGKNGINITVYERGHTPRVTFYNKVNGTDCQTFKNGTMHQICVKTYGYDKDLGTTRVCLQLGVAIFNHGVASTDFGCFRFGSAVRHEGPMDGESPRTAIFNRFILANNYSNINNRTGNGTPSIKANLLWLVIAVAIAILFDKRMSL